MVSFPTLVALIVKYPDLFMLAERTESSFSLKTGILSPVNADSSTDEFPLSTVPSTGTRCPGRTTTSSPTKTCSNGISISVLSRMTVAVFGARSINLVMASDVRFFDFASRYLPSVISVRIVEPDSKYKSCEKRLTVSISACPNA